MKDWGRYELTDAPAVADVVYEVRFTNPIVDRPSRQELGYESRHEPVYDPQLHLTLLDPKTRIALWSLTEHIQPAGDREGDNRSFDQAVARIVDDAKMVAAGVAPAGDGGALTLTAFAPPGALEVARRQERREHSALGALLGGIGGTVIAGRVVDGSCGEALRCVGTAQRTALQRGLVSVSGILVGAAAGWLWPTHQP